MKKILIIVGTRPEAIKLFPVYKALVAHDRNHKIILVTTGQHGPAMMDPLLNFFGVSPDIELNVPNPSLNEFSANLLVAVDKILVSEKINITIVQGDTTSSMVASLASFYRGVKVAHVEAGLRTYNRRSPFPEEVNRRIVSLVTDVHFVPTEAAKRNLITENVEGRVEVVGNTVIDSAIEALGKVRKNRDYYLRKFSFIKGDDQKIILMTAHRRENIGRNFAEIGKAITILAEAYPHFEFVLVQHVNPAVRAGLASLEKVSNVRLLEPLPYDDMIFLISECYLVLTDSGGLQEECPSLDKPVVVLRDTTERPEGIEAGCSVLGGVTAQEIVNVFRNIADRNEVYAKMAAAVNPYGDGQSSSRIASLVHAFLKQPV